MKEEFNTNLVPCDAITAQLMTTPLRLSTFLSSGTVRWIGLRMCENLLIFDVLDKMQQMRDHCDKLERERMSKMKMYIRDAEE